MSIFKKKADTPPSRSVDRSHALPGITRIVDLFAETLENEPDLLAYFLYVVDKAADNTLFYLCPTAFVRLSNPKREERPGFSMYFTEKSLGEHLDKFRNSKVSEVFATEHGVVDNPGSLAEKGPFRIVDFGYDSEAASAVIARLLEEVFGLNQDSVSFQFQLFDEDEKNGWQEKTETYDSKGNRLD